MSEDEIRNRIAQDIATEIRRLVGLLEALSVNSETNANDIHQVVEAQVVPQQPVEAHIIAPQPQVQVQDIPQQDEVVNQRNDREVRVGDRVQITNHYGRRRGQTGVIIRVTPRQVVLRLDITQEVVTKRKTSIILIHN
jgi:hypothetical protein